MERYNVERDYMEIDNGKRYAERGYVERGYVE